MTSRYPCIEQVRKFCYICGNFETDSDRRSISEFIKTQYLKCYKKPMRNLDKPWVPTSICNSCRIALSAWDDKIIKKHLIIQPTIWREPKDHETDCYFCLCNTKGFNKKNKKNLIYPNVQSVTPAKIGTIDRSEETVSQSSVLESMDTDEIDEPGSFDFEDISSDEGPKFFDQDGLNDFIRDLNLPKDKAELCASRLQERNLLLPGTKVTVYRKREEKFLKYFSSENDIVYCNDIEGLINLYKQDEYKPEDWRLFIDSSKESLKAVLLHNGNVYAAVPIGHSTILKESYDSFKFLLEKIKYNVHNWLICGDFKMINLLVGLQSGNTKNPCFLCLWDSRARDQHWVKKKWSERLEWKVGSNNVVHESLVDTKRILLPPLHIKLGLMKQFVKALDRESTCFKYIESKFPNLTHAKIKEGIFVGPDIRKLMKDDDFIKTMTAIQKDAWLSFKDVVQNFLGNNRDPKFKTIVSTMLQNFKRLGCLMSMKLHFLFSHLDYFPENVGAFSEEMGERFHQDFKEKERHYQGRWDKKMMADYCWSLKREDNSTSHKRKSLQRSFDMKRERFHKKRK